MARGGQRPHGNNARSAYAGTSRGGQSRAAFIVIGGLTLPNALFLNGEPLTLGGDVLTLGA